MSTITGTTEHMARDEIARLARPLQSEADLDPLLERVGAAHFVLVGEASHGTAQY